MKIENKIIKWGLIITVISLILLLIIQPLNQAVFRNLLENNYQIKHKINRIEVNVNYAKVVVKQSKDHSNNIRYLSENSKEVVIEEKDNAIYMSLKNKFKVGLNTMHIVELTLNKELFESIDINMEVGVVEIENANVNHLNIDLNSGQAIIKNTSAQNLNLNLGIGNARLDNVKATFLNSSVEMGKSILNNINFGKEMKVKNVIGKISGQQLSGNSLILDGSIGNINVKNVEKGKISHVDSDLGIGSKTIEVN